jgi:hypothetical protein
MVWAKQLVKSVEIECHSFLYLADETISSVRITHAKFTEFSQSCGDDRGRILYPHHSLPAILLVDLSFDSQLALEPANSTSGLK